MRLHMNVLGIKPAPLSGHLGPTVGLARLMAYVSAFITLFSAQPSQAQDLVGTTVSVTDEFCIETVVDPGVEFPGWPNSPSCGFTPFTDRLDLDILPNGARWDFFNHTVAFAVPVVERPWFAIENLNPTCPGGLTGTLTGVASVSTNISPLEWDPSYVAFTDHEFQLTGDPMATGGDREITFQPGDFIEVEFLFTCPLPVGEMLLHNFGGADSGELGVLEPYSGVFSAIAVLQGITAAPPFDDHELTYVVDTAAAADGTVYASTLDWVVGAPSGYFSRLWKLDLVDPLNSEFIGYIGSVADGPYYAEGLAFGPDGKLYGAGYQQFTYEATIFEIDTMPYVNPADPYQIPYAIPTPLIEYGTTDYPGDIAFTCDGTLYLTTMWAGMRPLIEVDLDALTLTYLPTISAGVDYNGLAYNPYLDELYGVTLSGDVYEINRTTSVATFLSAAGLAAPNFGIAGATWNRAPTDSDSDGTCDEVDLCPGGADDQDVDGDGIPDACDLHLEVTGTCPGVVNLDLIGLTPYGQAAVLLGTGPGSVAVPSGACAGTQTGLSGASFVGLVTDSDGDGEFHATPSLSSACGKYLQLIDRTTCEVSNVVGPL